MRMETAALGMRSSLVSPIESFALLALNIHPYPLPMKSSDCIRFVVPLTPPCPSRR